jgi:hypothetical protein
MSVHDQREDFIDDVANNLSVDFDMISDSDRIDASNSHVQKKLEGGGIVIGKKETKSVNRQRAIVVLVLIASTIGVAIGVYWYIYHSEKIQFEQNFVDDAHKVFESIGSSLERTLGAIDILTATIVSTAHYTNQSWPFVTIPGFAIHAAKVRATSDGIGIFFQPVVQPSERIQWEEYSMKHQGWVHETIELQEKDVNFFGPIVYDFEPRPFIFGTFDMIPYNETYVV